MTAPTASTAARGYGRNHQAERERWRPTVDAGQAWCHATLCVMPTRWIPPGAPWDLGHTIDRNGWTGPEHRKCNRGEPSRRKPQLRAARRAKPVKAQPLPPLRTSRAW